MFIKEKRSYSFYYGFPIMSILDRKAGEVIWDFFRRRIPGD